MNQFKRFVAVKLWIKKLQQGTYVKGEEAEPSHVLVDDGRRVSRVNVIGVIVNINDESFVLDDGTGQISVRTFEQSFQNFGVGDLVAVIGRPREFGELYILVEIVRKITDPRWLEVRKSELGIAPIQEEVVETDQERILKVVRSLDAGNGVDAERIVSEAGVPESIIQILLKNGEIFETSPGRFKVLD